MKIEWRRRDSFWLAVVLAMALLIIQLLIGAMYTDKELDHYKALLERARSQPAERTH